MIQFIKRSILYATQVLLHIN